MARLVTEGLCLARAVPSPIGLHAAHLVRVRLFIDGAWRGHVIIAKRNRGFDVSAFAPDAGRAG